MENLRKYRKAKGLKQKELGDMVGVSESFISQLEKSRDKMPSFDVALKLANALGCEPADLATTRENRPNVTDRYVSIPVIGEVAAGYDSVAVEDWTNGNLDIPETWLHGRSREEFFVLRISGNSMFPTYQDGDLVLVLRQTTMNHSGEIGVVMYDDDKATLKRVEYVMGENWMRLSPINPNFPPVTIRGEQLEHCRVLGIPKMLIRKLD